MRHLSLSEAVRTNRLAEFIAQEEARGIGPIDRADFEAAFGKVVKAPRSGNRTSRSASHDGSSETETPPDNDPYQKGVSSNGTGRRPVRNSQ
jgi:hypothetical protein